MSQTSWLSWLPTRGTGQLSWITLLASWCFSRGLTTLPYIKKPAKLHFSFPTIVGWKCSFGKSHLDWDLRILQSFQGHRLNSTKHLDHLVSMLRFDCFSISRIFFFVFSNFCACNILHISCNRASNITTQVRKFQEKGATLQTLKNKMLMFNGYNISIIKSWLENSSLPGSMMLWWIPWMSHWPKWKKDGGKLTCWFYLKHKNIVPPLGIKPTLFIYTVYIASSHICYMYNLYLYLQYTRKYIYIYIHMDANL